MILPDFFRSIQLQINRLLRIGPKYLKINYIRSLGIPLNVLLKQACISSGSKHSGLDLYLENPLIFAKTKLRSVDRKSRFISTKNYFMTRF